VAANPSRNKPINTVFIGWKLRPRRSCVQGRESVALEGGLRAISYVVGNLHGFFLCLAVERNKGGVGKLKIAARLRNETLVVQRLYGTDLTDTQSFRGVDLHCGARAVDQFLERPGAEHNQPDVAHTRAYERVVRQIRRGRPGGAGSSAFD